MAVTSLFESELLVRLPVLLFYGALCKSNHIQICYYFNQRTTEVLQLCVKICIFLQVFGDKWML